MGDSKINSPKRRTNSKSQSRTSSFSNSSSPWFRRNSFLSPSMIESENISIYEGHNYYSDCSSYNIISLKECQGFIFNQDLFASPYQQSRSLANEKKMRSLSFNQNKARKPTPRRHTSVNFPNEFHSNIGNILDRHQLLKGNAIDDEDDEHDISETREDSINQALNQFEQTTVDISLSEDDVEDFQEFGGNGYKVEVTEIIVDEEQ